MKINVGEIEYNPTPEQLAEEFCALYEEGQSRFFNKIGEIFKNTKFSLPMQLQYITDCEILNSEGRHVMGLIGDYKNKNFVE